MIYNIMSDGPESPGGITLFLGDYHTESPLPDPTQIHKFKHPNGEFSVRIRIIWDYYAVSEIISATLPKRTLENWQEVQAQEDAIIKSLTNHFPEEFDEAARGGHVWRVNGSLSQLCETFELFVQSLEAGCTGADDDFYDYWPNAMDMALTFAKDLNKITKTDQFTRRLQKAYESVVRRRPEIAASGDEAWEWPDKQYMQKLQKELDV
jgi:hypothetical protein